MSSQPNLFGDLRAEPKRWKPTGTERTPSQLEAFRELDADLFMAYQIFRAGRSPNVLQGVTSSAERKARIREAILAYRFETRFLLDARGKPTEETFAQAFERLYREPLQG